MLHYNVTISADSYDELRQKVARLYAEVYGSEAATEPAAEAKPKKKAATKKAAPAPTPAPAPVAETNGNGRSWTQEELVPVMQNYAAQHGTAAVRQMLLDLKVSKLSELDEQGRAVLASKMGAI